MSETVQGLTGLDSREGPDAEVISDGSRDQFTCRLGQNLDVPDSGRRKDTCVEPLPRRGATRGGSHLYIPSEPATSQGPRTAADDAEAVALYGDSKGR